MKSSLADVKLDTVLNTLVDGVIIIDESGAMQLFNPACEHIFGYAPDEVLGQNVSMLMPAPDKSKHDDYIENYKKTGKKKIIGIGRKVEGQCKDGRVFPMDLAVAESRDGGERIFIGIIRDLTETYDQTRKFEALREEHFRLSRVTAMNEMGSAIAHELNQPLSASVNYMETVKLLLNRDEEIDIKNLSDLLDKSSEQVQRASEIIARMRRFIERGDVEKENESVVKIIDAAALLTLQSFANLDIKLEKEIDRDVAKIYASAVQIQQVLVNVIRNACEAMANSPEKVLCITASNSEDDKWVEIIVSDTGHGLTPSDIDSLFVPFSTHKPGGIGVGLSISQSIIAHHGGQIWASQNAPQGTCFHIKLPISARV